MGDWWAIRRLRLSTPRLELRIPSYDDLLALGDVAAEGIHDPAEMPFGFPWSDASPPDRARSTIQWHWRALGYEPDGIEIWERQGEAATMQRLRLSRDRWAAHATTSVTIHDLDDDVLAMLGVQPS